MQCTSKLKKIHTWVKYNLKILFKCIEQGFSLYIVWFREFVFWKSLRQSLEDNLLYPCCGRCGGLNLLNLLLFRSLSFWAFHLGVKYVFADSTKNALFSFPKYSFSPPLWGSFWIQPLTLCLVLETHCLMFYFCFWIYILFYTWCRHTLVFHTLVLLFYYLFVLWREIWIF